MNLKLHQYGFLLNMLKKYTMFLWLPSRNGLLTSKQKIEKFNLRFWVLQLRFTWNTLMSSSHWSVISLLLPLKMLIILMSEIEPLSIGECYPLTLKEQKELSLDIDLKPKTMISLLIKLFFRKWWNQWVMLHHYLRKGHRSYFNVLLLNRRYFIYEVRESKSK